MLSAGPILHNNIHLLIITKNFLALTDLLDMSFPLLLHILLVLSLETNVCSILSFILFFWGHNEHKIVFSTAVHPADFTLQIPR